MVCVMVCVTVQPARAVEDKDGDGDVDLFDLALGILAECADDIAPYVAPYVEEYITKPVKNWWYGEPEPKPEYGKELLTVIFLISLIFCPAIYLLSWSRKEEKKPSRNHHGGRSK